MDPEDIAPESEPELTPDPALEPTQEQEPEPEPAPQPLTREDITQILQEQLRAAIPQQTQRDTGDETEFDWSNPQQAIQQAVAQQMSGFQQQMTERQACEAGIMSQLGEVHPEAQAYVRALLAGTPLEALRQPNAVESAQIMAKGYEQQKGLKKVASSPGTTPVQATTTKTVPADRQAAIELMERSMPHLKGRIKPEMLDGAFGMGA